MKATRKQPPEIRTLPSNREARARAAELLALARQQIEGLMRCAETDAPPLQLLVEIQAFKRPLREAVTLLLANHLHHCVIAALQSGTPNRIDAALDELVVLYTLVGQLRR